MNDNYDITSETFAVAYVHNVLGTKATPTHINGRYHTKRLEVVKLQFADKSNSKY